MQVAEPVSNTNTTYCIFGCTRAGCSAAHESWQAFAFSTADIEQPAAPQEIVLPNAQASQSRHGEALQWGADALDWGEEPNNSSQPPDSKQQADTWGASSAGPWEPDASTERLKEPLKDNKNASKGTAGRTDSEDFDGLLRQLQSALTVQPQEPQHQALQQQVPDTQNQLAQVKPDSSSTPCKRSPSSCTDNSELPCFHLHKAPDPSAEPSALDKEQQHIDELLRRYQQQEAALQVIIDLVEETQIRSDYC